MQPDHHAEIATQTDATTQNSPRVGNFRIRVRNNPIEINIFLGALAILVSVIVALIPYLLTHHTTSNIPATITPVAQVCTNTDESIHLTCWSDWQRQPLDNPDGTHGLLLISHDGSERFVVLPTLTNIDVSDYPSFLKNYLSSYGAQVIDQPANATAVTINNRTWNTTTVACSLNNVEYAAALYGVDQTNGTFFVVTLAPTTLTTQADQRFQTMLQSLTFPA